MDIPKPIEVGAEHFAASPTKIIEIDDPRMVQIQRNILRSKPLMRKVHLNWYSRLLPAIEQTKDIQKPVLELGCGASFLEEVIPEVLKSDVVKHFNSDLVVDAESLPFPDGGLRAIVMVGVLHHIRNPENFFEEASRTLAPGGRFIAIEPSDSPLHKYMTNRFNPYEFYDDSVKGWTNHTVSGRMSQANNAIPSLIFRRDRALFEKRFPELEVRLVQNHTFLSYYVTGGMSYRSFLPPIAKPLVDFVEFLSRPFHRWLGTMMTIDVRKIR